MTKLVLLCCALSTTEEVPWECTSLLLWDFLVGVERGRLVVELAGGIVVSPSGRVR